jgi:hypothetical protein
MVSDSQPVYRAPMRARAIDAPPEAGAAFGLEHGLVGTGDALEPVPSTLDGAVEAASARYGDKAARMLRRFADLPGGSFVWTKADGFFHLGRISGPWRFEDSRAAREVGIHHVRPATWLDRPFSEDEAPAAVVQTFARGGRNFQRIRDGNAQRRTAELWAEHS